MKKLRITIGNKSYEVTVEDLTAAESFGATSSQASAPVTPPAASASVSSPRAAPSRPQPTADVGAVTSPMAGQIQAVLVKPGDSVHKGQPLVVLEAMKMENQITAPMEGVIKSVEVQKGDQVQEGHVLLVLE